MTEPLPEDPPVEEPLPEDPPADPEPPPVCGWPNKTAYRNERMALQALGSSRSKTVVLCPVGHWHVVPKNPTDAVPNPDPIPAEAELANVEER